jgi:NodT family efflux transporter outer membrane factor (OMF) lipoprotein
MSIIHRPHSLSLGVLMQAVILCGCTAGPSFVKPAHKAPDDWTSWSHADASLRIPVDIRSSLPADWWQVFQDPVLERLELRAFAASPDLATAALHFAESRLNRRLAAAQHGPEVDLSGGVNGQRISEFDASTRVLGILGRRFNFDRQSLVTALSEPFNLYQVGFDASWEPDLWGRVRRSVEAADADVANQAALLDLARLTLASEVARAYFEVRTAQRQERLLSEDIAALTDRLALIEARVKGGLSDDLDLDRERAELDGLKAQLPAQLAQKAAAANELALLLGELPGSLTGDLAPKDPDTRAHLPDLALGLPSEVALRRPDIRAAEARLHQATAAIGVAEAELYPSVRLGAQFGTVSYIAGNIADWASRAWTVGASLDLPLFDNGRRRTVVQLRTLEQQEAAVAYQRTVLVAWREIDDALTGYAAEQQQATALAARMRSAGDTYTLARARYDGGTVDFLVVLDAQRSYLQSRRDLVASEGRLNTRFVMLNKAIGNVPDISAAPPQSQP